MVDSWIHLAQIMLANFNSYRPAISFVDLLWVNILIIIPVETIVLLLVSRRILPQRLKFRQLLALAVVANLVSAGLGFPVVSAAGVIGYPPVWLIIFFGLSSVIEGATYMVMLRGKGIRFEPVFLLAGVVNLCTYIPVFVLGGY